MERKDENGRAAGGRILNNFVYLCKNGKLNITQQDSYSRHSPITNIQTFTFPPSHTLSKQARSITAA